MKKFYLSLLSLFLLCVGNYQANCQDYYYYPMILSCGVTYDYVSDHILTDVEILTIYNDLESIVCGLETPKCPSTEQEKNP